MTTALADTVERHLADAERLTLRSDLFVDRDYRPSRTVPASPASPRATAAR
jgi:hypothetical protein